MFRLCAMAVTSLLVVAGSSAQDLAPDYARLDAWLCHPDNRQDPCDQDLSITTVAANGRLTTLAVTDARNPSIDCFYVYPTTSLDPTLVSDLQPGKDEEVITAYVQAARYRTQCRVFAPMYRQNTVASLMASMAGKPMTGDRSVTYADVLRAWNHYVQHENQGRGFVLIGHSQGAGLLARLVSAEIDGQPIQRQLVSAQLIGSAIAVPQGQTVGGRFKHIPLCTAANQIGCVISFASFRDTRPPLADSPFGRVREAGHVAACTNPAALAGGKADLTAILSRVGEISLGHLPYPSWTAGGKDVVTPFVSVPGLLTAECVQRGEFSYLEVRVNADPTDARTDDIVGDLVSDGQVLASWGLHLIDMSLVMGDLMYVTAQQVKAYSVR